MESNLSRIMFLECIEEHPYSFLYRITYPGSLTGQSQRVLYNIYDCSIQFIEPRSEYCFFLEENEKWLRKILSVFSKAENKRDLRIPFTFPPGENRRSSPDNSVKAYCDGSCNADGSGGWGAVILKPDGGIIETSGREENSTSNRMELMAAYRALEKSVELLPCYNSESVILFTDSMYVIKGITHRFSIWNLNGFVTARGTTAANIDLCRSIYEISQKTSIFCEWIKSGTDDIYHKRCDFLAGEESRKLI